MRDATRPLRWAPAAVALAALVVGLAAPAVTAQEDDGPWAGSKYEHPTGTVQSSATFDVVGVFDVSSGTNIQRIDVTFGQMSGGEFTDQDGDCVPGDRDEEDGVSIFRTDDEFEATARSGGVDNGERVRFTLADRQWPCNGAFAIQAVATQFSLDDHELLKEIRVAIRPPSVEGVEAEVSGDANEETGATEENPETVTVTWNKLAERPESEGYRIKRAGPESDESFGAFETIGSVAESSEPKFEHEVTEPGRFRYRVVALRDSGVDEPPSVESTATEASTATVRVAGDDGDDDGGDDGGDNGDADDSGDADDASQTSPVTTADSSSSLTLPEDDASASGSRTTTSRRRAPPTTADTGFEETLDYGDAPEPGDEEALAGEGQSVIRTEDDGTGLLGPAAGALVLLGWAGHVAYLNRLAKQF